MKKTPFFIALILIAICIFYFLSPNIIGSNSQQVNTIIGKQPELIVKYNNYKIFYYFPLKKSSFYPKDDEIKKLKNINSITSIKDAPLVKGAEQVLFHKDTAVAYVIINEFENIYTTKGSVDGDKLQHLTDQFIRSLIDDLE